MGTRSKRSFLTVFAAAAFALLPALSVATEAEDARSANDKSSRDVLKRLFKACPGARAALRASEGFATFAGVGTAQGSGVAKPTRTRTPVYMQFAAKGSEGGKRDLVFIFKSRDDFSGFVVKGATLGGAAEAPDATDCSQVLSAGVRVIQLEGDKVVGGEVPSAHYSRASLN
jgi:hypothetical protein